MGRLKRLLSHGSTSLVPSSTSANTTTPYVKPATSSFLALPAELRAEVYAQAALDTQLVLTRRKGRAGYDGPGLLLANQQISAEYGAYLWALARITIDVYDFDFRPVNSIVGSLFSKQLRALRTNRCLKLRLNLGRSFEKRHWQQLRRWLAQRTNNIDLLPWAYEVTFAHKTLTAEARAACLRAHEEQITATVSAGVLDELSRFELHRILDCIETELYRSMVALGHMHSTG